MVVLLGGPTHTGKTVLAQRLMEQCLIPYLSIDHLKMGLIRGLQDCPISPCDSIDMISSYLWPIIKGIIDTTIENHQHLIIEGCYLPYANVQQLCLMHQQVICQYLVFSPTYLKTHTADLYHYENIIEKRLYPNDISLENLQEEHRLCKQACEAYHLPYLEIQTHYQQEVAQLLPSLLQTIAMIKAQPQ